MSDLHQQVNDLTALEIDKERIEQLQRKQQPKTKVQRMKGFFIVLFVTGVLCQFLSALLASSGVLHYVSTKLNSNGLIISMTSICILLLIEVSKRFTLESFHAQRLDDKEINRVTYGFILLWMSLSVGSTYYGTPYAVEYFAAAPTLVNTDSIKDSYNNKLAHEIEVLENEIKTHEATALDIKTRSSWKGRISREARPAYLAAIEAKKQSETNLSAVAILNSKDKFKAIQDANSKNEEIQNTHFRWCMSFGSSLAVVSIFLELLFFICMFWCENYKRLEVKEAKAILTLRETDNSNRTTPIGTKIERLTETDNETDTNRTVIAGFRTDNISNSIRTCSNCGTDITSKRSDAKFCTAKCRGLHHKNKK